MPHESPSTSCVQALHATVYVLFCVEPAITCIVVHSALFSAITIVICRWTNFSLEAYSGKRRMVHSMLFCFLRTRDHTTNTLCTLMLKV